MKMYNKKVIVSNNKIICIKLLSLLILGYLGYRAISSMPPFETQFENIILKLSSLACLLAAAISAFGIVLIAFRVLVEIMKEV